MAATLRGGVSLYRFAALSLVAGEETNAGRKFFQIKVLTLISKRVLFASSQR